MKNEIIGYVVYNYVESIFYEEPGVAGRIRVTPSIDDAWCGELNKAMEIYENLRNPYDWEIDSVVLGRRIFKRCSLFEKLQRKQELLKELQELETEITEANY